jgi:hypothetical protein
MMRFSPWIRWRWGRTTMYGGPAATARNWCHTCDSHVSPASGTDHTQLREAPYRNPGFGLLVLRETDPRQPQRRTLLRPPERSLSVTSVALTLPYISLRSPHGSRGPGTYALGHPLRTEHNRFATTCPLPPTISQRLGSGCWRRRPDRRNHKCAKLGIRTHATPGPIVQRGPVYPFSRRAPTTWAHMLDTHLVRASLCLGRAEEKNGMGRPRRTQPNARFSFFFYNLCYVFPFLIF